MVTKLTTLSTSVAVRCGSAGIRPLASRDDAADGFAGETRRARDDVVDRIRDQLNQRRAALRHPFAVGTVARLTVLLVDSLARRHLWRAAALARFQEPPR